MAELPLAIWLVILCFAFPLLILATLSIRYGFFWNAAREACTQAAHCQTFLANTAVGGTSAVNTANNVASTAASAFTGITMTSCDVIIISSTIPGGVITRGAPGAKLASPADPENNQYTIEVALTGQVEPLIRQSGGVMGQIVGLTAPFPVKVTWQNAFENTQGLNL